MSSALSSLLLANHKGDASALRLELQDPTKVLALLQSSSEASLSALANFIAQEVTNEVPVTTAALRRSSAKADGELGEAVGATLDERLGNLVCQRLEYR